MTVFYRLPSRPRPRPMTSRLRTTIAGEHGVEWGEDIHVLLEVAHA